MEMKTIHTFKNFYDAGVMIDNLSKHFELTRFDAIYPHFGFGGAMSVDLKLTDELNPGSESHLELKLDAGVPELPGESSWCDFYFKWTTCSNHVVVISGEFWFDYDDERGSGKVEIGTDESTSFYPFVEEIVKLREWQKSGEPEVSYLIKETINAYGNGIHEFHISKLDERWGKTSYDYEKYKIIAPKNKEEHERIVKFFDSNERFTLEGISVND
ncbi:hypothetical protein GCM10011391_27890 [Pullulanibacillus camelliae]|uniref:Uncharacterized protein n=1 Tax=Pullulanibacillus camelliae TaxID=1707096 RepID=A0A8J2YJ70_9BACL|nr:hypothetical protein [Pullulanibacillus camelliae]GGE47510.1 hypothetical protein GCM10011391_27890 [Pullulanibacillus camelliae]